MLDWDAPVRRGGERCRESSDRKPQPKAQRAGPIDSPRGGTEFHAMATNVDEGNRGDNKTDALDPLRRHLSAGQPSYVPFSLPGSGNAQRGGLSAHKGRDERVTGE